MSDIDSVGSDDAGNSNEDNGHSPCVRPDELDFVPPLLDSLVSEASHGGIKINMGYLLGERDFITKKDGHDAKFTMSRRTMGMKPTLTTEEKKLGVVREYEFKHIEEVFANAKLKPDAAEMHRWEQLVQSQSQGDIDDCFVNAATYLLFWKHPEVVEWLFEENEEDKNFIKIRVKVHGEWVTMYLDKYFSFLRDIEEGNLKLALISLLGEKYYCPSVMEKCLAKLHGSHKRLTAGDVCEALSYFLDCYGLKIKLGNLSTRDLKEVIYKASKGHKMIAFVSKFEKSGVQEETVCPEIILGHAFVYKKFYKSKYRGKPILLYLFRDVQGIALNGPFTPRGEFFGGLDPKTRGEITADLLKEPGCSVIPADLLALRFETAEIMDLLPPCPKDFKSNPHRMRWTLRNIDVSYSRFYGKFEDRDAVFRFLTSDGVFTLAVVQIFEIGKRLTLSNFKYIKAQLTVKNEKGEVIAKSDEENDYQLAVVFSTNEQVKCSVLPRAVAGSAKGIYRVDVFCLEGAPKDPTVRLAENLLEDFDTTEFRTTENLPALDDGIPISCKLGHSLFWAFLNTLKKRLR